MVEKLVELFVSSLVLDSSSVVVHIIVTGGLHDR
jgi:hypothetical protein